MSSGARLCREIIKEDFGLFTATVANQLLLKGRSTLNDLVRFSGYTNKRVKEILIVLIQHGIVYFSEPTDDIVVTDKQKDATYYEINIDKILIRLRMGRIMRITEEHYGKAGSAICQLLLLYGRVKLSQVQAWAKTNDTKQKDEAAYTRAFTKMAIEQFITAVLPQHSRSMQDKYFEAEERELGKYTITTAKELQSIKDAAKASVEEVFKQTEFIGMKRKAQYPLESEAKRLAIDQMYALDDEEEEQVEAAGSNKKHKELLYDVDPEVFFTLNYDKYNLYFRNHMVTDFATSRINRTAGIVMKTFFRSGKSKMQSIKEDYSPAATSSHIANLLEPEVFLRGDIVLPPNPSDPTNKPGVAEVVQAYFQLLRNDNAGFLTLRDELGANQYAVNFKKLKHTMKRTLFEGLLTDRFGVASCRIVRILMEKGKLDESRIQKLAMLPPKDVRYKLGMLLTAGIVEIQEIPRSSDRAPSRSFHLWYVPIEKCFEELLVDVYRAMGNLQQRKVAELARRSRLLEKLNRKDVIANMDLLNEIDKVEVAKMDKVIERLEISKGRLDEMIMILRDF